MELESTVESLDNVPEPLRVLYKQSEGEDGEASGFQLAVDPDELESALVPNLKSALGKERTGRKKLEKQVNSLTEQLAGIDLDEYNALREAAAKAKNDDLKKKGDWETMKAQLEEQHSVEVDKRDKRIGQLESVINSLVVDNVATMAIAELKGQPELLLPH